MPLGFVSTAKRGQHFDLAKLAIRKLQSANLALKGKFEREFEQAVIGHLQSSPKIRKNLKSDSSREEKLDYPGVRCL